MAPRTRRSFSGVVNEFEVHPAVLSDHQSKAVRLAFTAERLLRRDVHAPAGIGIKVAERYASSGSQVVTNSLRQTGASEAPVAHCPQSRIGNATLHEPLTPGGAAF